MHNKVLVSIATWFAAAALFPICTWCAQRQIEVEPPGTYRDPILITKVTVRGKEVQCHLLNPPGQQLFQSVIPFEEADDWLTSVDVHIFNRTNKEIVTGQMII